MNDSGKLEKGKEMLLKLQGDAGTDEVLDIMKEVFPDFWKMTHEHLYGDMWARPKLSLRERMIATLAALQALVCVDEMKRHMRHALNIGISEEEIFEIIIHVMNYSGWPTGVNGMVALREGLHLPADEE